jgi:hypothetical protein
VTLSAESRIDGGGGGGGSSSNDSQSSPFCCGCFVGNKLKTRDKEEEKESDFSDESFS